MQLLDRLMGVLYPRHHGPELLAPEDTDRHVRQELAQLREVLTAQIELELQLVPGADAQTAGERAEAAADALLADLPVIRDLHDTDIAAALTGDPSARSIDEIILCFPGIAALLRHRIAHRLFTLGATILGRIEIGRGAVIGGGVWLTVPVAPGAVVTQAAPKLVLGAPGQDSLSRHPLQAPA